MLIVYFNPQRIVSVCIDYNRMGKMTSEYKIQSSHRLYVVCIHIWTGEKKNGPWIFFPDDSLIQLMFTFMAAVKFTSVHFIHPSIMHRKFERKKVEIVFPSSENPLPILMETSKPLPTFSHSVFDTHVWALFSRFLSP